MDAKATGGLITQRRKELGMSQGELAARLHVTDKAVSRWETGRGMPSVDLLEPLAAELGLSVSELLSGRRLAAEELPRAAGEQITQSLRRGRRMGWRGAALALVVVILAAGLYQGALAYLHYTSSVEQTDLAGLERQAADYLGRGMVDTLFQYGELTIVETEQKGDYLAALCSDGAGHWAMCVYDRDERYPDRWRANGGKRSLGAGEVDSWNFGTGGDAVIIVCGGDLPGQAAWYTFQNSGTLYACPVEGGRVLDVFFLPDNASISANGLALLDEEGRPLDGWQLSGTAEQLF